MLSHPAARVLCLFAFGVWAGGVGAAPPAPEVPRWVANVGAKHVPTSEKVFPVKAYGAVPEGKSAATAGIQAAIDAASAAGGGIVSFEPGTYLTGALFVKSHVHLRLDRGVVLMGVADDSAYPRLPTRVAGIEMTWPAALINVNDAEDVKISGGGQIDGNGEWCWAKFSELRREYEPLGVRWATDYDAERVRLLVISKSHDVTLQGVHLRRAGFWTVQVVYSDHITVDGIKITDNQGPSTDGVDVDSSSYVLVEHCDIDNNDDDICVKSGRDADGMRVNRPAEYVVIRDNITRHGAGMIGFGSETSGGIRHVVAYGNKGIGTSEGIRFKSARTRGGYIDDVLILDTTMEGVPRPITFTLDWNPAYSYATLPKPDAKLPARLGGKMPAHWQTLTQPVALEKGLADFANITISGVDIKEARQVITAHGQPTKPLRDIRIENVVARGERAGTITHARNWSMTNVKIITPTGENMKVSESVNVALPVVEKGPAKQ